MVIRSSEASLAPTPLTFTSPYQKTPAPLPIKAKGRGCVMGEG